MAKFIVFFNRLINLYLYFILGACLLSWVPNINPNYPLFHAIFTAAGFYILPPFMGLSFSPALVMLALGLVSVGLVKIYNKFYAPKEKEIIVLTPEEFIEKINKEAEKTKEDSEDDSI